MRMRRVVTTRRIRIISQAMHQTPDLQYFDAISFFVKFAIVKSYRRGITTFELSHRKQYIFMAKKLIYPLLLCSFIFISTELMLNTLIAGHEVVGYQILLLIIPATLIFCSAVVFTAGISVPQLLLKEKYLSFTVTTFATAFLTLLLMLINENTGLATIDLPPRAEHWSKPWLYLERFCNSFTMMMILFGLGAFRLFDEWQKESAEEVKLTETLKSYVARVRGLLDKERILSGLDAIKASIGRGDETTSAAVEELSAYLRHQLYDLPSPPQSTSREREPVHPRAVEFLIGKRWHWLRLILFESVLLIMSCAVFFKTPDVVEVDSSTIILLFSMFLFLNVIAIINRYWLFRRYRRHGSVKRYLLSLILISAIPLALFIICALLFISAGERDRIHPFWIIILAGLGSMMTIYLYVAGVTAILLLQHWVEGKRRIDLLAADTAREEYLFLKAQINPHFLFNVLNNISILSCDSPDEARNMVEELHRMIEYQFEEEASSLTSPCKEVEFLDSYLTLEATRTENLTFEIISKNLPDEPCLPSLLLIPVVENAVKHGRNAKRRWISISLICERNEFNFECANSIAEDGKNEEKENINGTKKVPGGIGLANLRRRLNLIYGDDHNIEITESPGRFEVSLRLHPLKFLNARAADF